MRIFLKVTLTPIILRLTKIELKRSRLNPGALYG